MKTWFSARFMSVYERIMRTMEGSEPGDQSTQRSVMFNRDVKPAAECRLTKVTFTLSEAAFMSCCCLWGVLYALFPVNFNSRSTLLAFIWFTSKGDSTGNVGSSCGRTAKLLLELTFVSNATREKRCLTSCPSVSVVLMHLSVLHGWKEHSHPPHSVS